MINFNDITTENTRAHNANWWLVSDQPCRILITGEALDLGKQNSNKKCKNIDCA